MKLDVRGNREAGQSTGFEAGFSAVLAARCVPPIAIMFPQRHCGPLR